MDEESRVQSLLSSRPDLERPLREVRKVDAENSKWTFDDVDVDSGAFGELVDAGIVVSVEEHNYQIYDEQMVSAALDNERNSTDKQLRELFNVDARIQHTISSLYARWPVIALLGLITLLGLYLRLRQLGVAPFWVDEAIQAWAARGFAQGVGFTNPAGTASYSRSWLTVSLPMSLSFSILGFSEFAARLPISLVSVIVIPLSYLIAKQLNRPTGLLAACFIAFDPFILAWARSSRMYAPLSVFFIAGILLTIEWNKHNKLKILSPASIALLIVSLLGLNTHRAYLAIGPIIIGYLSIDLLDNINKGESMSIRDVLASDQARAFVVVAGILSGFGYLLLRGVPDIILIASPEVWPVRGPSYYFNFLETNYLILLLLSIVGSILIWVKEPKLRILVIAFVLPFTIASITPRKAPRYIYHLMPLFAIISLSPLGYSCQFLKSEFSEQNSIRDTVREYSAPLVLVIIVAILVVPTPVLGYASTTDPYDSPYYPERSDWRSAGQYLEDNADNDDVIVSTMPILSMWYYDRTDYFFRQNGLKSVERRDGGIYNSRTGTEFLNTTEKIQRLMDSDKDIWILAGKKFRSGFTAPDARQLVEKEFTLVTEYENMDVYYRKSNISTTHN